MTSKTIQQLWFEKIIKLLTKKITMVEGFVDFLLARTIDKQLTREAQQLSEPLFSAVWDNDQDVDYDKL